MLVSARLAISILCAGFVYSGVATLRLYGQAFQRPAMFGESGSIDASLAPVLLASAEQLRAAVTDAKWSLDADVVLVSVDSSLSRQDLYQVYYSASYVLYPRRVWLATSGDDISRRHARHVLLVGAGQSFRGFHQRRLTPIMSLVKLP